MAQHAGADKHRQAQLSRQTSSKCILLSPPRRACARALELTPQEALVNRASPMWLRVEASTARPGQPVLACRTVQKREAPQHAAGLVYSMQLLLSLTRHAAWLCCTKVAAAGSAARGSVQSPHAGRLCSRHLCCSWQPQAACALAAARPVQMTGPGKAGHWLHALDLNIPCAERSAQSGSAPSLKLQAPVTWLGRWLLAAAAAAVVACRSSLSADQGLAGSSCCCCAAQKVQAVRSPAASLASDGWTAPAWLCAAAAAPAGRPSAPDAGPRARLPAVLHSSSCLSGLGSHRCGAADQVHLDVLVQTQTQEAQVPAP